MSAETDEPDVNDSEAPALTEELTTEEFSKSETGKKATYVESDGNGNGQAAPGQHADEDSTIINNSERGLSQCKILPKIDRKSILRRYYLKAKETSSMTVKPN